MCMDTYISSVRPVGRIDYLHTNGSVGESLYYYNEDDFLKRVKEDNYYGTPMVLYIYRDDRGKTIPLDFVKKLDPYPQGLHIIDFVDDMESLVKEVEALNDNTPNGVIVDADTILADITEHAISEGGMQDNGTAQYIFDIWKRSSDREGIEAMFEFFTTVEFKDFLLACKERITKE